MIESEIVQHIDSMKQPNRPSTQRISAKTTSLLFSPRAAADRRTDPEMKKRNFGVEIEDDILPADDNSIDQSLIDKDFLEGFDELVDVSRERPLFASSLPPALLDACQQLNADELTKYFDTGAPAASSSPSSYSSPLSLGTDLMTEIVHAIRTDTDRIKGHSMFTVIRAREPAPVPMDLMLWNYCMTSRANEFGVRLLLEGNWVFVFTLCM